MNRQLHETSKWILLASKPLFFPIDGAMKTLLASLVSVLGLFAYKVEN